MTSDKKQSLKPMCLSKSKVIRKDLAYHKIGTGPFQLSSKLKGFPLPDLKDKICFFGRNSRPDVTIYDLLIHIGLKRTKQSLKAVSGQRVYLSYAEGLEPYLQFSNDTTPLWIMPYLSESGKTFIEMGMYLEGSSGEVLLNERKTFGIEDLLNENENKGMMTLEFQEAVEVFAKGKWWSNDRLFEAYGGEKYSLLKHDDRIEFPYEMEAQVLYVKKGETLIWKGGKWKKEKIGKHSKGFPLAYLKCLTPHQMEWELWDREGLLKKLVSIGRSRTQSLHFQIDEIFSSIRQRTASRISCRIENKTTMLKSGDWILRTSAGWHVLKTLNEIEDVLHFRLRGELFVFDGILQKKGKSIFSGTLFDLMRTEQKSISISLADKKNKKKSTDKKKMLSTKIQPNLSKSPMENEKKRALKK